ncbi:NADH-ubiquinone oxidoreductase-F iron-sulfur binding region domain-containing protein [uncultured Jatrophihabitans sp.]|uniref:NADH-ubiquinone oxidoreductase-F iron-sulfur binding region domain-containing protein n=1 Tax=uncultured Jatrophihabitans sp. TaxID=1610747 RepID=UPI0035CBB070
MTAMLPTANSTATASPTEPVTWAISAPRLLAGLDHATTLTLAQHLAVHGPMLGNDVDRLLAHLDGVGGIAGRGGAGFPFAAKIRALAPGRRRLVVNGTESEPASSKDRVLLRRTPHLVLDGALATGAAIGAHSVTVAVHDERTAAVVRNALAERSDARRVRVQVIGGGFVAGEARAVARATAGGPALPPGRRDHLTDRGVLLANVETFAQLTVLLRIGPHRFGATGTADEPGTTLLSVGGAVARHGVVEVPLGTPLDILLAATHPTARPQAVVLGGYHGSWLAPIGGIRLSRAGAAAAGGTLGAGVLLVVGEDTCALGELARVTTWLAGESAQQCGPCTFGLPALARDVGALAAGAPAVGAAFDHARTVIGRGACAHPDGAARFVTSGLHLLHDETDSHLAHGGCGRPVLGQLPIAGG